MVTFQVFVGYSSIIYGEMIRCLYRGHSLLHVSWKKKNESEKDKVLRKQEIAVKC